MNLRMMLAGCGAVALLSSCGSGATGGPNPAEEDAAGAAPRAVAGDDAASARRGDGATFFPQADVGRGAPHNGDATEGNDAYDAADGAAASPDGSTGAADGTASWVDAGGDALGEDAADGAGADGGGLEDASALGDGDADATATAVTWHGAIRAIFEVNCNGCHTPGNIAPFPLDTYPAAKAAAPAALAAIEAGIMPPWPPDPACRHYQGERLMAPEDIAAVEAWVAGGMPEGDPADYAPPVVEPPPADALGPPDLVLTMPEPYTPDATKDDDYRCFILDHVFEQDTWVRMTGVEPGNLAEVHHVLLYLLPEDDYAKAKAKDDAAPGPGYTCFGGPGAGSGDTLGGWAPGNAPVPLPDDSAILIPAGARIIMQVHYNVLNGTDPDPGTSAKLWLASGTPSYLVNLLPFPNLSIVIEPGDPHSEHVKELSNSTMATWEVLGVLPHMHLLGKRITVTAVHTDGSEECLVDIPEWDFDWQQTYAFLPGEEVDLEPEAKVRLECVYDNSPENQPIVGGVQQEPKKVKWGEGTLDEMCLVYLTIRRPYVADGSDGACAGFDPCYQQCRAGGGGFSMCLLQCSVAAVEPVGCATCGVGMLYGCLGADCGNELAAAMGCVQSCYQQGDVFACTKSKCTELLDTLDVCATPVVDAGGCDEAAAQCGIGSLEAAPGN